jgi:proteic killer suppression protein
VSFLTCILSFGIVLSVGMGMEVRFKSDDLDRLETDGGYSGGYSQAIIIAFRKRMQLIRSAADERDFYALKSLHFEKLKGDRSYQHSMRLNDQWRLILEIDKESSPTVVTIVGIEDYH